MLGALAAGGAGELPGRPVLTPARPGSRRAAGTVRSGGWGRYPAGTRPAHGWARVDGSIAPPPLLFAFPPKVEKSDATVKEWEKSLEL
ncbi:hypothetical protein Ate01nite_64040 [Actinoplanes teichomyceticus]|nr:hypothetical protein Ate01nite_64040 [Actinoplanes teichomyceticus]